MPYSESNIDKNLLTTLEKESLPQDKREQLLFKRLSTLLTSLKQDSDYYQQALAEISVGSNFSRDSLSSLPILRKSSISQLQAENPPLGGLVIGSSVVDRIFQSPGNIYEGAMDSGDWWRMSHAFHAAGFRKGDIVLNCLSYHMTPGGFIMDSGARACGCSVIPAGPGQTEQQLHIISQLQPTGYSGTPSFLNILLDKAKEKGVEWSISKALVSGEALSDELRTKFLEHGIKVHQAYATADVGLIAYEANYGEGWVVAEDIIVEIVKPGTSQPVTEPNEVGELVVTVLNDKYPLIRFATGDLSAFYTGVTSCGRSNLRIKGWMGRADQTVKVKGLFVHPSQVQEVIAEFPEITKARLIIERENHNDVMSLHCEYSGSAPEPTYIAESIKRITKLTGDIQFFPPNSLNNDGIVIEDLR
ncbi:phenylacetate--CoA ligase family protein [Parashewanella tropica]|uniref:phenylacetate--CoA ligase family protein n=1 Tax=Parashewanella tropica TaxID=2547970 RepID=UPI001059E97F|nr:AMP-binding protein [Parashewanella tropica]